MPERAKTFQTKVSRREDYRIAGYDAAEGGVLPAHRDNSTPHTQQRRFTLSIILTAEDFSGGALRFPEYGPQLYSVGTGGAVVFSCALLHEATRVTQGRRLVLLGFFYSEAEQAMREKMHAQDTIKEQRPP